MKTSIICLSFMAAAMAAPSGVEQRDAYAWTPALAGYYEVVAHHIEEARSAKTFPSPPACDLSQAILPVAPTPLPAPDGLKLSHVALGRGVQNYTCTTASADAKPAAVGAVAKLYNASCVAAAYPDLLSLMPNLALQYPLPSQPSDVLAPPNIDLSGHHFFSTNTTPVFELNSSPSTSHMGVVVGKKTANSTAPAGSSMGVNGQGNGAVPWLYLTATNASEVAGSGSWAAVYRVDTAGGQPPKTCEGVTGDFSVQYASLYWFYKMA